MLKLIIALLAIFLFIIYVSSPAPRDSIFLEKLQRILNKDPQLFLSEKDMELDDNFEDKDKRRLRIWIETVASQQANDHMYQIGYPVNHYDFSRLSKLNQMMYNCLFNNVGNATEYRPYSHWHFHSLGIEKSLLKKFIRIWGSTIDKTWAAVTTGGSEGNVKGILNGARFLMQKNIQKIKARNSERSGLRAIFTSDEIETRLQIDKIRFLHSVESHYSVEKILRMLGCSEESVKGSVVNSDYLAGSMDCADLEKKISTYITKDNILNFVVIACLGTTFKGGNDNLDLIKTIVEKIQHSNPNVNIYIHLDGALGGGYWEHAVVQGAPRYTIGTHFHSISFSAHKWHGGVFGGASLIDKAHMAQADDTAKVDVLSFIDESISGSRDGKVCILWLSRLIDFQNKWQGMFERCRNSAIWLQGRLIKAGAKSANLADNSLIVWFYPPPLEDTCHKFNLMTSPVKKGSIDIPAAHVMVMPHVTNEILEIFLTKYEQDLNQH
jgi:glutamate/tyrosine decarboxylase-like PLP-dependent enzyme